MASGAAPPPHHRFLWCRHRGGTWLHLGRTYVISVKCAVLAAVLLKRNQHSDVRAIFFRDHKCFGPPFLSGFGVDRAPHWLLFFLVLLAVVPGAALLIDFVFMFYKPDGKNIYIYI